jgi:predicted S18 family serine protease
MIDINLLIAIVGVLIAFLAMFFSSRNGSKEIDEAEHEKIAEDAYKDGKIDTALSNISETASRTERKVDTLNTSINTVSQRATEALQTANTAQKRADEAHVRIDEIERGSK